MAETALWWVLLTVLDLVFISTVSLLEVLVGAALALLGAVTARFARRAGQARFGGAAHWAAALWSFPATLLADLARLARVVLRPGSAEAGFRAVELAGGTGAAWACTLISATPGSYAVSVDPPTDEPRRMLLHGLDRHSSALERAVRER
ncbi:Na+/H+ antiporter subunit E [Kitasatospora humi]|uniref:Na+/H+ antiporter subunit E n=1 Tax=Kitasatospora humi TaxID=2893891 RepID=UPI0027DF35C8|nr:Na+/H+ antiporter subunit E [Kitasatospora humi]